MLLRMVVQVHIILVVHHMKVTITMKKLPEVVVNVDTAH